MIKDPETEQIEILEAKKYTGDKRIDELLLRSMGKIGNYREFPISRNTITYFRRLLGESKYDSDEQGIIMNTLGKGIANISKANIKERKVLENLSKSKEGREEISAVSLLAQLKNKNESILEYNNYLTEKNKKESEKMEFEQELDNEESNGFATEWKDVKDDMMFWNSDT